MESEQKKNNSRVTFAIFLVVLGIVWLLSLTPFFTIAETFFRHLFIPLGHIFANLGGFLFSWQMIFILTGIVLLAGKRQIGIVFIVLGGLLLAPEIFTFHLNPTYIFPAVLIAAGIVLIAKITKNKNHEYGQK